MRLTTNFDSSEFRCRCKERGHTGTGFCGGTSGPDPARLRLLTEGLQKLRDKVGKPVVVSSGYRCPGYNATLPGAAKASQHMTGGAADVRVEGYTSESLMQVVEEMNLFTGRGIYPKQGYIHVDVRAGLTGKTTRWVKEQGKPYKTVSTFKGWI